MGGGSTPNVGAVAQANQRSVFGMDNLTRAAQELYIQEDPQHRNPSNKKFVFLLEMRKYQSKIRDMIKEKNDYLAKFRPLIESVVDKAGRFDNPLTQEDEVRSQNNEIREEFSVVLEKFTSKKYENLNRRLLYAAERCSKMVKRVQREVNRIKTPAKNPAWKRVLNPELELEGPTIRLFVFVGRMVQDDVNRVFREGHKLHCDLLKADNKHLRRILEFERQARKNIKKKIVTLQRKAEQDAEDFKPKRRRTE